VTKPPSRSGKTTLTRPHVRYTLWPCRVIDSARPTCVPFHDPGDRDGWVVYEGTRQAPLARPPVAVLIANPTGGYTLHPLSGRTATGAAIIDTRRTATGVDWPPVVDRLETWRREPALSAAATTTAILDRLTTAHNVVDGFDFEIQDGEDAHDVLTQIGGVGHHATELVEMLAALAALLSDAGSEIARLNAECAGLRARCGK